MFFLLQEKLLKMSSSIETLKYALLGLNIRNFVKNPTSIELIFWVKIWLLSKWGDVRWPIISLAMWVSLSLTWLKWVFVMLKKIFNFFLVESKEWEYRSLPQPIQKDWGWGREQYLSSNHIFCLRSWCTNFTMDTCYVYLERLGLVPKQDFFLPTQIGNNKYSIHLTWLTLFLVFVMR